MSEIERSIKEDLEAAGFRENFYRRIHNARTYRILRLAHLLIPNRESAFWTPCRSHFQGSGIVMNLRTVLIRNQNKGAGNVFLLLVIFPS